MIADMHCHYPMHLLVAEDEDEAPPDRPLNALIKQPHKRGSAWQKFRAFLLMVFARLINFRRFWGTWRVDFEGLRRGDARLILSVLYLPFAEFDFGEWPDGRPEDNYFAELGRRIDQVEEDLATQSSNGARALVMKREADLDEVLGDERLIGFAHCVEGGFSLGCSIEEIDGRVKELARRGVVYITLAHLFPRQVAANANAIPLLSDGLYDRLFPQPHDSPLSDIGEAAVRAMHRHGVLIDISHMRDDAIDRTFALVEELDGAGRDPADYPIIASHSGFRFEEHQAYLLSPKTIERLAARRGAVGLIMAQHQMNDGVEVRANDPDVTEKTLRAHVDAIGRYVDPFDVLAIGSDLDGFIKPTLKGVESAEDLGRLSEMLERAYPEGADRILWRNAERVVRKALAGR